MSETWVDPAVEQLDEADEHEGNGAVGASQAASLFGQIQHDLDQVAARHTYDLDVPGYFGRMVLRLAPVNSRKTKAIRDRWAGSKSPDRDFNLNADTLIAATQQVLVRREPDDPLQPLADDDGDPIGLDDRLATILGLPAESKAREVLLALFGRAHSPDVAVEAAGGEYMLWLTGETEQVREDVLGE